MRWSLNCFVSKTCACVYCLSLVSPWLVALRIEGHMKRGTMACVPSSALMSLGVLLAGFAVYVPRTEHRTPCRTDSDSMSLGWLLWPRPPTFGKRGPKGLPSPYKDGPALIIHLQVKEKRCLDQTSVNQFHSFGRCRTAHSHTRTGNLGRQRFHQIQIYSEAARPERVSRRSDPHFMQGIAIRFAPSSESVDEGVRDIACTIPRAPKRGHMNGTHTRASC